MALSYLDDLFAATGGPATELATTDDAVPVGVRAAPPTALGQVLTVSSLSPLAASWSMPSGGGANNNLYIDPPTAAHAFDDEFDAGSADLAERGWIIRTGTTTLLTRAGEVLLGAGALESTAPVGIAADTYRSSIIDGRLFLQIPDASDTFIYRAVSGGPAVYAVRGSMVLTRANQLIAACVARDNPATENFAGGSNRHAWTGYHHNGSAQTLRTNLGGEVYGNAQVTVGPDCGVDLHVLRLVGPAPLHVRGAHIDSQRRVPQYVQRCYDNSHTLDSYNYAGIRLIGAYSPNNNNTVDTAGGLFVIDYVREMDVSLTPWFGEY